MFDMNTEYEASNWAILEKERYEQMLRPSWEDLGGVTLNTLLQEGCAPHITTLPANLQERFGDRPWPQHSLYDRLVDQNYLPYVKPLGIAESWELELIGDNSYQVDGKRHSLAGDSLAALNILMLTRDTPLKRVEAMQLGFFTGRSRQERKKLFDNSVSRLMLRVMPHQLMEYPESRGGATRMHGSVRICDRRD